MSHFIRPIAVLCCVVVAACASLPPPVVDQSRIVPVRPHNIDRPADHQQFLLPGITGLFTSLAADRPARHTGLEPYQPYVSPDTPADPTRFRIQQIVIKFAEGTGVRLRDGKLVSLPPANNSSVERLARLGLEPAAAAAELLAAAQLIRVAGAMPSTAAPRIDPADLERLWLAAEANDKREHGDPNLVYFLHLPPNDRLRAAALLKALRGLNIVEYAHYQPIPQDAQPADLPPTTTIDATPRQGYLRPGPAGVDWDLARRLPGGNGAGVRIADIEAGWITGHEDLPPFAFGFGVNWGAFDGDHGTAVFGEIAAGVNGFGADGLAPAATIGWSSVTSLLPTGGLTPFYSTGNALLMAALALRPGDIALIEQHYPSPASIGACTNGCNCPQFGFVAVETYPFEHSVIRLLSAAGIIVVEAAGNGQQRVVPASVLDSGAIVVGASQNDLTPACFTNFGPRVDVHAWGAFVSIGSLGYGLVPFGAPAGTAPLRGAGADRRQWYTFDFSGTSAAAPVVTGSAALIQSIRRSAGLPALDPFAMRSLLIRTGTRQAGGAVAIGPQPDLSAAVATFLPDAARFASLTPLPARVTPGQVIPLTAVFANSGGRRWAGGHRVEIAPSYRSGLREFGSASQPAGTAAAPLLPADTASAGLSAAAPGQPGSYDLVVRLLAPDGTMLANSPPATIVVAAANQLVANASIAILSAPGSLRAGTGGSVVVRVTNTGQTTWTPSLALIVRGGGRLAVPANSVPLSAAVPPGGTVDLRFDVVCNSQGRGSFNAQMSNFGSSVGQVVVCQP